MAQVKPEVLAKYGGAGIPEIHPDFRQLFSGSGPHPALVKK